MAVWLSRLPAGPGRGAARSSVEPGRGLRSVAGPGKGMTCSLLFDHHLIYNNLGLCGCV